MRHSHATRRVTDLDRAEEAFPPFGWESISGRSRALAEVLALAQKVATDRRFATVLLVGETGTGKELFARAIHTAGPGAGEPFVPVNCAAIPEPLLESELFGHERGAFTDAREQKRGLMELAGTGTLFLDEVGELPSKLQPKLLRALEDRRMRRVGGTQEIPIRCRFIAATNSALEDAVSRGEFREDLFYRLNAFHIPLPPLREREDDIELLAGRFLDRLAAEQGTHPKLLSPRAIAALRAHRWPGNVRELRNVVERAALFADGERIEMEHLMIQDRTLRSVATPGAEGGKEVRIPLGGKTLAQIEEEAIRLTLQLNRGNRSATARVLAISRPTLARKMRQYGLDPDSRVAG